MKSLFRNLERFIAPFENSDKLYVWAAHSPTIGAGMPDLLLILLKKELALCRLKLSSSHMRIVAWLRTQAFSGLEKISVEIGISEFDVEQLVQELCSVGILETRDGEFRLSTLWTTGVVSCITVEAKAKKWREAVRQASRNRAFANHSFIALPGDLAEKIVSKEEMRRSRIGLLGINDSGEIEFLKDADLCRPLSWFYFYESTRLANEALSVRK